MGLTLEQAFAVIRGSHDQAQSLGLRISTAIVNESGVLIALARMEGAFPLSAHIAEAKAVGSALWHRDGDELSRVHAEVPGFFAQVDRMAPRPIMPGPGSILIKHGPDVLGAVGVSGASGEKDAECALAGLRGAGLAAS